MLSYSILFAFLISVKSNGSGDTVIRWSEGRLLQYSDFRGQPNANSTEGRRLLDTSALIHYAIRWKLKMDSGRNKISAFAVFFPESSWIGRAAPHILQHEQGHFDISEIYAKRLEQAVNQSNNSNIQEFLEFLASKFKEIDAECEQEQLKYDNWTRNTPGKEYYFNWIDGQLRGLGLK